jgi:hypothetical protein
LKGSLRKFFAISIVLHVLAFAGLNLRFKPQIVKVTKPEALKSYIYTPPKKVPEPVSLDVIKEEQNTSEPSKIPPDTKEVAIVNTEQPILEKTPEQVMSSNSKLVEPSNNKPTTQTKLYGPGKLNVLGRSLQSIRSSVDREIVEQASREYSAKRSLSLMDSPAVPLEVGEYIEPQIVIKPKEVDCNNDAAWVLTNLSGLFGGTMKCQKVSGHQDYINKRLNKQNVLESKPSE